jgi:hypothetical protein
MTKQRFIELMGEESGSWNGDNAFKGLLIIKKYTENVLQGAGHDEIWSEDIDKLIENGITEEDVKELRRLNWMVNDNDCLACFV